MISKLLPLLLFPSVALGATPSKTFATAADFVGNYANTENCRYDGHLIPPATFRYELTLDDKTLWVTGYSRDQILPITHFAFDSINAGPKLTEEAEEGAGVRKSSHEVRLSDRRLERNDSDSFVPSAGLAREAGEEGLAGSSSSGVWSFEATTEGELRYRYESDGKLRIDCRLIEVARARSKHG